MGQPVGRECAGAAGVVGTDAAKSPPTAIRCSHLCRLQAINLSLYPKNSIHSTAFESGDASSPVRLYRLLKLRPGSCRFRRAGTGQLDALTHASGNGLGQPSSARCSRRPRESRCCTSRTGRRPGHHGRHRRTSRHSVQQRRRSFSGAQWKRPRARLSAARVPIAPRSRRLRMGLRVST